MVTPRRYYYYLVTNFKRTANACVFWYSAVGRTVVFRRRYAACASWITTNEPSRHAPAGSCHSAERWRETWGSFDRLRLLTVRAAQGPSTTGDARIAVIYQQNSMTGRRWRPVATPRIEAGTAPSLAVSTFALSSSLYFCGFSHYYTQDQQSS